MFLPVMVSLLTAVQQASLLDRLAVEFDGARTEQDFAKKSRIIESVRAKTLRLIDQDKLTSPTDFLRAAEFVGESTNEFQWMQVRYELLLTSVALGVDGASTKLGQGWDDLLVSMSRGRRLGLVKMEFDHGGQKFKVNPTASAIIQVFSEIAGAMKKARDEKDNKEIQSIVDADQKARSGDWSKLSMEQIDTLGREDEARLTRIRQIVSAGELATANDFANAALVCQHGEVFEDFALAHELSVCALLLGKKSASWLAGASYDRMLDHSGMPQRFATQYTSSNGSTFKLARVETQGINDTERKAVIGLTLKQARNRKWD